MIISTRESQKTREKVLDLGISQISGASSTSVGGYAVPEKEEENSAQFDVSDNRTLDEVVNWLLKLGYIPSFCTACYREGRTGDRFMSLVKSGQIANCCHPNAIIDRELLHIPNEKARESCASYLHSIDNGKRDFRF